MTLFPLNILLYLLVYNLGQKLLLCEYKNKKKTSGTCKLQVSENDSTVLHSTLTCFLLFSQDFSHKVVCFAYEENNQILFVAKQVLIAHLNLKEIFPNISKFL